MSDLVARLRAHDGQLDECAPDDLGDGITLTPYVAEIRLRLEAAARIEALEAENVALGKYVSRRYEQADAVVRRLREVADEYQRCLNSSAPMPRIIEKEPKP